MDKATLLAGLEFSRARLLGLLDGIEKTAGADIGRVLAWRPGPGRAHIGWQAMHCAATHDRYINVRIKGGQETDPELVKNFAGGSTPSDILVPTMPQIREAMQKHYTAFKQYIESATADDLAKQSDFPNNVKRTAAESIVLLTWHEGHHQGQIHLTWNMYKAAHGIV
ncbi:MAG: DinB family protein [Burkholderiales bacterium]|nr:DinB family protein [Phycisphaerae bacterium]